MRGMMLVVTKAILLALHLPRQACSSHASNNVHTPCKVLVHKPAPEAELQSVKKVSRRPKRKMHLKCNTCDEGKQFQSILAVMGLESKVAHVDSAQADSAQHCEWHTYEFSDLCMTCFLSLLHFFDAELKLQGFWNVLHHTCCRCYAELTGKYGLEAIHELKSASVDVFELLKWRDEHVQMPDDNLPGAPYLEARAPLAKECTEIAADTTCTKVAEDRVGGIANEGVTTCTATAKTTSTLNANIPSGAVQQAGAVWPATLVGNGGVTNLLSVGEQHSFGMRSEALQLSHEYIEMLGLIRSWWFNARTVVTQANTERSTTSTTSTAMESACATGLFSTQHWLRLQTFLCKVAFLSAVVMLFQVRSYLVYC